MCVRKSGEKKQEGLGVGAAGKCIVNMLMLLTVSNAIKMS